MRLATWNVNSVRMRESHVRNWLARAQPDLLLLQEIKCEQHSFPDFSNTGYSATIVGQKSYNGVAVLGRIPFQVELIALPGLPETDAQARYLEISAAGIRIGNLYLPNGGSGGADGLRYKFDWMDALRARSRTLLEADQPRSFLGDYNVCPTAEDHAPGTLSPDDALIHPESRRRFRAMLWQGLTDAVRALNPGRKVYTFWDYQAGAWRRDAGLRIDHALLSPQLAQRLQAAGPDRAERGEAQPSDHVPVIIDLA